MSALGLVLNAVICGLRDGAPVFLTVPSDNLDALPAGPLEPERDRTLEAGLRRWLKQAPAGTVR